MSTYRIVFATQTTTDLKLAEASVTSDNGITAIWQNNEKVFAVPTANVVAIERIPDPPAPTEPPKEKE